MKAFDAAIIGAGGAGMMCALTAAQGGARVVLIDHASRIGRKILISGGGRCNFTNLNTTADNYWSENPHFAKSALSRYSPSDFISLVKKHGIRYHEKKLGQLFCDKSAQEIVDMLVNECKLADARFWMNCLVNDIEPLSIDYPPFEVWDTNKSGSYQPRFRISTSKGEIICRHLIIATGGLSVPKIGATGFGYDLARRFGLHITALSPALDGFVFDKNDRNSDEVLESLQGISLDSIVTVSPETSEKKTSKHSISRAIPFRENILFTHDGLSGPASLQASLYWNKGEQVKIDFAPETNISNLLINAKSSGESRSPAAIMAKEALLPKRVFSRFTEKRSWHEPIQHISQQDLISMGNSINAWLFRPAGTVGYKKAEVTRGGVDTKELSSRDMQSKKVPGLYFIGEVVDVTGQLGGFNFQWAWASGHCAGVSVLEDMEKNQYIPLAHSNSLD